MKKQIILSSLNKVDLTHIFERAIKDSYKHICQIFDPKIGYKINKTSYSFSEILEILTSDKNSYFTATFKTIALDIDLEHWCFEGSNQHFYFYINVRPDLAEKIFSTFKILI